VAAAKASQRFEGRILVQATALPIAGLAGVFVRSFLIGMNLLSKTKTPSKVFADVADALAFLSRFPGQNPVIGESLLATLRLFVADARAPAPASARTPAAASSRPAAAPAPRR